VVSLPLVVTGGLQLRQLLPEAEWIGIQDLLVHRCVRDPRQVRPGDVWVAVPGRKKTLRMPPRSNPKEIQTGGEISSERRGILPEEIALAIARGATAVVAEHPLPGLPIPQVLTPDVREAWGRICQALAGHPSKRLKVIAVMGHLGVTPTCWLLRRILAEAGYRPGLLSRLGSFDGKHWLSAGENISGPEMLASQLVRMLSHQCTHAVVEVSSGALAEKYLAGMDLDGVCLTPFGRKPKTSPPLKNSPFARFSAPSAESGRPTASESEAAACYDPLVAALRDRLFRYLTAEGLTVLSADDPISVECLRFLEGPVLTVGIRQMAEITAHLVEQQLAEQTFLLQAGADVTPVRTRRIGQEHRVDCLLAAAVGLAYGMDLTDVIRGLESVESVPGHLERIEQGQPFGVFLDAPRSGLWLRQNLRTLKGLCQGRLWCVAGLGPGQRKKTALFAQLLPQYVDRLLLTPEEPTQGTSPKKPPNGVQKILDRFPAGQQALWTPDRGEAIWTALQQAEAGDCVLILSRLRTYSPVPGRKSSDGDDRRVVQFCLESLYPEELPLGG